MLTIKRYVKVENTDLYELNIDDEFLKSLIEDLKSYCTKPDEIPTIDEKTIKYVMQSTDNAALDKMYEFYYSYYASNTPDSEKRTYTQSLREAIQDYIDDEIWDGYVDCVDSESLDYEDVIA